MRVVVLGATGNVGTSVVRRLCADERIEKVIGVARRPGGLKLAGLEWQKADIRTTDLATLFGGADVVVHLAWIIQPSHLPEVLRSVNVEGTRRVLDSVGRARVPALVYASSVGAYAPGPKDAAADENWPATGVSTSSYAQHKAQVERDLDAFEREHPDVRVVRLRPGLTFKRSAANEIRRYFLGHIVPTRLIHPRMVPFIPEVPRLRFQVVHTDDVADAYVRAVTRDASGAFNVATDPILDPAELGRILGAAPLRVPVRMLRMLIWSSWRARLQPTSEGWLDMALSVPVMSTERICTELGWRPSRDAASTLLELMEGLRARSSLPTPALR